MERARRGGAALPRQGATAIVHRRHDGRQDPDTQHGLADVRGKYELDHFISLELGGSNAVTNLWPELYGPAPGAHEKDQTENYLHTQMCTGKMTMAQAQTAIRTDWYAVYHGFTGK